MRVCHELMTHPLLLFIKLKNYILWLQGETYYQVGFLGTRVSSHLSEDWNRERICNLQILGCFHTYMSNGEAIGITIEGCSKWNCTYTCLPITAT